MELLIGLAVLVLFDVAAWRWGVECVPGIEQDDPNRSVTPRPARAI